MLKLARVALAVVFVSSTLIQSASAGPFQRLFGCGSSCEADPCATVACESTCEPVSCSSCWSEPVSCGCGEVVHETVVHESVVHESAVVESAPAEPTPAGSGTRMMEKPKATGSGTKAMEEPTPAPAEPATSQLPPAPVEPVMEEAAEEPTQVVVADEPVLTLPPVPAASEEPKMVKEEPATEEAVEIAVAEEAPAEAAAAEESLFDDANEEPAEAATSAEDDLFGDTSDASDSDDGAGLFDDEPATEKPAEEKADEDDPFGGLFDDEPADSSDDDPFGSLQAPGGLQSDEFRVWTDNSGLFRTSGRLASISSDGVQLVTESGHTATVPLDRLSGADLEFVDTQAKLQRVEQIARTALR